MTSAKPLPPSSKLIILLTFIFILINLYLAITLISTQNSEYESKSEKSQTAITIIDGDTFETLDGETIRLLCVDTPELGTTGSEEAKSYLSNLILGKDISIERAEKKDKYNRTLAWITQDNVLINKEIVDNGFGSLFEYEDTDCSRMK